jgi:soluble lytic murein transglycosylase-like protein
MSELLRHRWGAVLAGFLLLLGASVLDRATALAASAERALAGDEAEASELALKRGVVAALAAKAPRVDAALSNRIAESIARCGREQELAPDLVLAVVLQESSARPGARSPKGALGLMQVMPHMWDQLALPGSAVHVETNMEAGCRLLADNIRRLGEERGVSAYFWGNQRGNPQYLRGVQKLRRDLRPYLDDASEQVQG